MIAHAAETGSFLSQYWDLLHDPAHWMFEITTDLIFAAPALVYTHFWVRRHDKAKHSG